jgi:hypothetical protein
MLRRAPLRVRGGHAQRGVWRRAHYCGLCLSALKWFDKSCCRFTAALITELQLEPDFGIYVHAARATSSSGALIALILHPTTTASSARYTILLYETLNYEQHTLRHDRDRLAREPGLRAPRGSANADLR